MENQSTAIVSLTDHKISSRAKIELDGVRRSLSMLPWDLEVQQVLTFAGLSVSEMLLADNVAVSPSSEAAQLGHSELKDLVTKQENEDGLGLDWDDFNQKMTALIGKQKYSINERDYHEVNNLIDDATAIIGRKPSDVGEFHGAKQKALQDKVASMEREFKARTMDIQDKNSELMRSLTDSQGEIKNLHDENTRMMQEAADKITDMTREMAVKQEILEQEANERMQEEANKIKDQLHKDFEIKKSELARDVDEANSKRMQAELAVSEIQIKIDRGELISPAMLHESEKHLEEARNAEVTLRNQLLSMNSQLTESEKIIQSLKEENTELSRQVSQLTNHTSSLELRIREVIEDKLGSSEFAVLQERLSIIQSEKEIIEKDLEKERSNSKNESRKFSELRGRFQQMKQVGHDQFKMLNESIMETHKKNIELSERVTKNKSVIGIMLVLLVASSALAAYPTFLL